MEKVGRYDVKEELGRGGMATVYLAHDPSFGRFVALKALPRAFMHDQMFLERFQREARTIASLEHMAIVPVYDYGQHEGLPFLVMRYMSGGTLADRLADGPLPLAQAAIVMERIADALDYSHSRGVIHRDLKPGNILFDDRGNPFLSDFGIAKLAEATANLTGSAIIGTPAYMSPEQVHGTAKIDGRSDVYALGIILFQMLTGKLPYQADTPARQLMAHVLEPIPNILDARQDLPAACEQIITRAMAKERDARFDTPGRLAAELKAAVGDPVAAEIAAASPPPQPQPRAILPTEVLTPSEREPTGKTTIVEDEVDLPPTPVVEPPVAAKLDLIVDEEPQEPPPPAQTAEPAAVETSVGPLKRPEPAPAGTSSSNRIWIWGTAIAAVVLLVAAFLFFTRERALDPAVDDLAGEPAAGTAVADFIEAKWGEGFDVTTLAAGGGRWAVVMSLGGDGAQQIWHTAAEFPGDFIESKWAEGFDVTQLSYGSGRWVAVMARHAATAQQTWHVASSFPGEFIEEKWEDGFDVTELAYGGGRWAVILGRGGNAGQQTWHVASEFPGDFIESKWEEGFDVTSLAYGGGRWALIMTRDNAGGRQTWHLQPDFPAEYIEANWNEGFDVISLAHGDGAWVVVMTQDDVKRQQTWQVGSRFN